MGTFTITDASKDFFHTPEEIDEILDRLAEDKFSDEDDDILIEYAIHLLYKNGKREVSPQEISEKIHLLMVDQVVSKLEQKGLVECGFNENGEIVSKLTEQGKEVYENLVQKG